MKATLILALAIFVAVAPTSRGSEPTTAEQATRQNLLLRHPRPEYPKLARQKRLTGNGVFQLKFDYDSGHLREVHVVRSTGQPILDQAVIAALKQWQAKPRSLHVIVVPIGFMQT